MIAPQKFLPGIPDEKCNLICNSMVTSILFIADKNSSFVLKCVYFVMEPLTQQLLFDDGDEVSADLLLQRYLGRYLGQK